MAVYYLAPTVTFKRRALGALTRAELLEIGRARRPPWQLHRRRRAYDGKRFLFQQLRFAQSPLAGGPDNLRDNQAVG